MILKPNAEQINSGLYNTLVISAMADQTTHKYNPY